MQAPLFSLSLPTKKRLCPALADIQQCFNIVKMINYALACLMILLHVNALPGDGGGNNHHPMHAPPTTCFPERSTTMLPTSTSTMTASCKTPRYTYDGSFTYTALTSDRYATPNSSPAPVAATSYAAAFTQLSTLLPSNITYTTYSLNPSATEPGQYGQSAYAAIWTPYSFNSTVPFTTTRSPTPVATSELVFPPALYTACPTSAESCLDGYCLPKSFVWGVASSAWQVEGGLQSEGRGPAGLDIIGNLLDVDPDAQNAVVAGKFNIVSREQLLMIQDRHAVLSVQTRHLETGRHGRSILLL